MKNVTSHPETDDFREAAIAYLDTMWGSQLGNERTHGMQELLRAGIFVTLS